MDPINSNNDLDSLENSRSRNPIRARVFLFSLSVLFVVLLVATNSFFTSKYLNEINFSGINCCGDVTYMNMILLIVNVG